MESNLQFRTSSIIFLFTVRMAYIISSLMYPDIYDYEI